MVYICKVFILTFVNLTSKSIDVSNWFLLMLFIQIYLIVISPVLKATFIMSIIS